MLPDHSTSASTLISLCSTAIEEIAKTQVLETMVGGKVVYKAPIRLLAAQCSTSTCQHRWVSTQQMGGVLIQSTVASALPGLDQLIWVLLLK